MKKHILILALMTGALFAQIPPSNTVTVKPGDYIIVSDASGRINAPSLSDARDVVRAMEILLRFAPEKYPVSFISGSTATASWGFGTIYHQKTKAEALRSDAEDYIRKANEARADANKLEAEQAEIEWARDVLAKWKAKVAAMEK